MFRLVRSRRPQMERSKFDPEAELCGKRDSHGGTWTEEVAQCTGRHAELLVAGDRLGRGTRCIKTKGGGVGKIIHPNGQCGDVWNVVVAGIGSIQQVEELGKRTKRYTLSQSEPPTNPQIDL